MEQLNKWIDFNSNDAFTKFKKKDLFYFFMLLDRFYLEYRDSIGVSSNYTFGVEIEAEYIGGIFDFKPYFKQGWSRENDDSLSDGDEYISPIMTDKQENWQQLFEVCDLLRKNYEIKNTCGGHIHIGTHILGNKIENWLHLFQLWAAYENIIFRFSYGEFLTYRDPKFIYAHPVSKRIYKQLAKIDLQNLDVMDLIKSFGLTHSNAINFHRMDGIEKKKDHTIEIKCPNGTLEPIIWQNNINFFLKFLFYCKSHQYEEDRVLQTIVQSEKWNYAKSYNHIFLNQSLELVDMIFDNNLDKIYFLRQYLKSFQICKKAPSLKSAKMFIKKP